MSKPLKSMCSPIPLRLDESHRLKKYIYKGRFPLNGHIYRPVCISNPCCGLIGWKHPTRMYPVFISGVTGHGLTFFQTGNLLLSRGIKAGVRTMMEGSAQRNRKRAVKGSPWLKLPMKRLGRIRSVKKRLKLDLELAQQYFFGYIPGSPPPGCRGEKDWRINEDKIFGMIQPGV